MKAKLVSVGIVLLAALSCRGTETPTAVPTPTPIEASPLPVAEAFLQAWTEGDYPAMYGYLSSATNIGQEEFAERYRTVMGEATVTSLSTSSDEVKVEEARAEVAFTAHFATTLLGEFQVNNTLPLIWEGDTWRVEWSSSLIFPSLEDGDQVYLARKKPARANIYARDGRPLALEEEKLVTIGVVPGEIEDERHLLDQLSSILGMSGEEISAKYHAPGVQAQWKVPIADISAQDYLKYKDLLDGLPGVVAWGKYVRTYPQGLLVAQVVGYVAEITEEQLAEWASKGYQEGDMVGQAGLEKWGEEYLSGKVGGVLSAASEEGEVKVLQEYQPVPGQSIYTTIDLDLQRAAQEALGDKVGAVVALDPRSGEVLAMVSSPTFDPNPLVLGLEVEGWEALFNHPDRPLLNRATQGVYPTGSVFKLVTATAALAGAGFPSSTTIHCTGVWHGPYLVKTDWAAHGDMDFQWAITRSCDVFFFEMGFRLNEIDPYLLPAMAHKLGFGEFTGIEVDEAAGLVPDPDNKEEECYQPGLENPFWVPGDAVNLAVGQGCLQVTPLQVANMMAAIANGGTLYRPRLVLRLASVIGEEVVFPLEAISQLPLSAEQLQLIQKALTGAAMSPRGTAYYTFRDSPFPVAGKTGTAETPPGNPHAWFVGYAPADDPQIVVAVVVEHGGEGSVAAAPVVRKVMEAYLLKGQEGE